MDYKTVQNYVLDVFHSSIIPSNKLYINENDKTIFMNIINFIN